MIAVVDTGVDLSHPDLAGKLVAGKDVWEEVSGERDCPGEQDEDAFGHGTRATGIAAAATKNEIGIAGVAPNARAMVFKTSSARFNESLEAALLEVPQWVEAVIRAIRYAADQRADVISLSITLGPTKEFGAAFFGAETVDRFDQALEYAWLRGSVIVAAAGNLPAIPQCSYPATNKRAVCVASTDRRGQPATDRRLEHGRSHAH